MSVCHICNGSGSIGGGRRPEFNCPACNSEEKGEDLQSGVNGSGRTFHDSLASGNVIQYKKEMKRSPGQHHSDTKIEHAPMARISLEEPAELEHNGVVMALKEAVKSAQDRIEGDGRGNGVSNTLPERTDQPTADRTSTKRKKSEAAN